MDKAHHPDRDEAWGGPPLYFGFEVDTFADFARQRADVEAWLDDARVHLIQPVVDATAVERAHNYNRRTSMGVPGKVSTDVVSWPAGARGPRIRDYTPDNWDSALDAVRRGELGKVSINLTRVGADGHIDFGREFIELSVRGEDGSPPPRGQKLAFQLSAHATVGTYGGKVPSKVQSAFVDAAKQAMRLFEGCWGGVFLDLEVGEFAYERATFRPSRKYGLAECNQYARAYLWGNLLSATQVKKLGGTDQVARAPFARAEILRDDPPAVYLQATEDVHDFDDATLRRVRDYLGAVLPEPVEAEQDYVGLPLRLVKRDP